MRRTYTDDSIISGEEFRIRLLATGMEQQDFANAVDVKRNAVFQWTRGPENNGKVLPLYAQKRLEDAESDIDEAVRHLVSTRQQFLEIAPPEGWEWGEKCWYTVIARARYDLASSGVDAVIGEPAPGRVLYRTDDSGNVVKVDFSAPDKLDKAV
jgi:hypothetical protein